MYCMIRVFTKTDLPTLHQMIVYTVDVSYSSVYPPLAVDYFKKYHSQERITERNKAGLILVLVKDNFIIGTGSLLDSEIIGVFVHPTFQGKGYGKALMAELEKTARLKGLQKVNLSISIPSKKFYEHLRVS